MFRRDYALGASSRIMSARLLSVLGFNGVPRRSFVARMGFLGVLVVSSQPAAGSEAAAAGAGSLVDALLLRRVRTAVVVDTIASLNGAWSTATRSSFRDPNCDGCNKMCIVASANVLAI